MGDISTKYFVGVEIEINHHCNLACHYCPNVNSKRNEEGEMSMELFSKIIQQLADIKYEGRICYHFYNEPLLHPKLEDFVSFSKKILPKSRSEIFTNGMFLTLDKYKELIKAGVDKFVVTKHQGLKKIAFDDTFINLSEEEKKNIKFMDYSELIYTNRGGLVDYGRPLEKGPLNRLCLIPTVSAVITVKGNVLTCYEDYNQKNIMGNINEEHIRDNMAQRRVCSI